MAAVAAATKMSLSSAAARSSLPPMGAAVAAAADEATFPREPEVRPRKRPRSTTAGSCQESTEDSRPQAQNKQGATTGVADGAVPPAASDRGEIISGEVALGSGPSHRPRAEAEAPAPAPAPTGQGMDVEDDSAGTQSDAADGIGRGGEKAPLEQLPDGNSQHGDSGTTPREPEESDGPKDSEAMWVDREEPASGGVEAYVRDRGDAGVADGVNGEGRASSRDVVTGTSSGTGSGGTGGSGASNTLRDPGGDPSLLSARDGWRPKKGDLVEVERRMTPGVNKPGGTGSVVRVNATTGAVDVRYMVEGYWERGIDPVYVTPATLDLDRRRPTLGRCRHCGSLRVDCRQECDYFTAPPPLYPESSSAEGTEREGDTAESLARMERRRRQQQARQRKRERCRRRHQDRHPRPRSQDGGAAGDGTGRRGSSSSSSSSQKQQRRHLPEDYDEEGDPVRGSSQEERETGSGSSSNSDAPLRGFGHQRRNRVTRRLVGSSSSSSSSSSSGGGGGGGGEGAAGSEDRERWRRRGLSDSSDVGSGPDDSDVELLDVRRSTGRRSSRSRSRSRSRSSFGDGDGDGTGTSDGGGEQDRESEEAGTRRPGRDRGRVVPRESARGGYDQGRDAGVDGDGAAADARFLQPEGEDDELPPDIPDPTRGVRDREELQDELFGALRELEGDDLAELRDDPENDTGLEKLAAAVRR